MKIKIEGELRSYMELTEEVGKRLADHSPEALVIVELVDDEHHGNSVSFTYRLHTRIRVWWILGSNGRRIFNLEGNPNGLLWRQRCEFEGLEIDAGIRATAAYIAARIRQKLNDPAVETFEYYLAQEKAAV